MKNICKLFGAAIIAVTLTNACAPQYDSEDDFDVESNGSEITITGYLGEKQEVRIPPRIQNLPVTSIGEAAFLGYWGLTAITIPARVTRIGEWAFSDCVKLTEIKVAANNKVYSAKNGVLYDKHKTLLYIYPAGKIDDSFTIPGRVTRIEEWAFAGCDNLTSITIPNSVTSIGFSAFYNCSALTSITIPGRVTSIEQCVFQVCTNLASVTIPDSVTSIGSWAFIDCPSLVSVTFQGTIPSAGFEYYAFDGDLEDAFYAIDASNGTPGTYITTEPVDRHSVWVRQ